MYEPNEPHDQWGRPIEQPQTLLSRLKDVFFYTWLGVLFFILFGWITIIFLPYFLGREVWQRYENWYINKGRN